MPRRPTICPYLLKPLQPAQRSNEHVIPDALGGPEGFSVEADRTENSKFGEGLDGAFVNDDLLKAAAASYGIESRSGVVTLQVKGELEFEDKKIAANIEHGGTGRPTLHPRIPVSRIDEGYEIYADERKLDKHVKDVVRNNRAKGVDLNAVNRRPLRAAFRGRISHSMFAKTKGLLKIGYLALAYTFGDDFLNSNAGTTFRSGIASKNSSELDQTELDNAPSLFRSLPYEDSARHVIAAVRFENCYSVYVSLFGNEVFTRQFSYPLAVQALQSAQGEIFVVDAKKKTFSNRQFDPGFCL